MSPKQAQHVAFAFRKALDNIILSPHCTVKSADLFHNGHNEQLMKWNKVIPERKTILAHDVIMQNAALYPGAPAISSWDGNMTYRQLDQTSNYLASHLMRIGVGPEVIVPLCFEKSIWAVVAMVSVIKAGGGLVFLDPSHPVERRQLIINTVGAKMVLTSEKYSDLFSSTIDTYTINGEIFDGVELPSEAPITAVKPSNVLYVIFTSGSTGTPKGCVVEHQNFCSGVMYQKPLDSFIQRNDRVLQLASYTFDVSIMEIISSLMIGACICMPSQEAVQGSLTKAINDLQASWAFLTPSLARILNPDEIPSMKTMILGGEALSRTDLDAWAHKLHLVNGYGPSECSVAATCHPHLNKTSDPANIGRTMGSIAWVVDANDHNKLVPIGATGELLLEGPILARGYLNEPEKTAAAFIENPGFLANIGKASRRLYKTGDLVRHNPDGTIHFIGRKDTQVKLRGQRIELGEIEHHLYADERINHAIVIQPKEGACRNRLVAIFTLKNIAPIENADGPTISLVTKSQFRASEVRIQDIQDELSDHVPGYMVPTAWIVLNQIPLMASGKLNRVAIKNWVQGMTQDGFESITALFGGGDEDDSEQNSVIATSDVEVIIQEAFSKVLKLPVDQVCLLARKMNLSLQSLTLLSQIPMNLPFLTLGGDSISAMQIVGMLREQGIDISLRSVLQSKHIPQLAASASAATESTLVTAVERHDEVFQLSPIQQMFFEMASDPKIQFNQSFLLRLNSEVSATDLKNALHTVLERHSMLRARFTRDSQGKWVQYISSDVVGSCRFQVHNADELDHLLPLANATQRSLDIENGPLFAADLVNVDGEGQMLYLVAHHLVIDLVSWRIIMGDLANLMQGQPLSHLKPLPFQAWTEIQADYMREKSIPAEVMPLSIPPANYEYWGMQGKSNTFRDTGRERFKLDPRVTSMLLGSCHRALRTETMDIFLAALVQSFEVTFTDRAAPAIFSEGHGRETWSNNIDLSRTVGWFTTISPVHVQSAGDIIETVRRVKDIRRRLPGNGLQYFASRFMNSECREAFSKHWPLEILFNYHGQFQQQGGDDSDLQIVPLSTDDFSKDMERIALFDINATVSDGVAEINLVYNKNSAHQQKIVQWMAGFRTLLHQAVVRLEYMTAEWTQTDFPLLGSDFDLSQLTRQRMPALRIQKLDQVEDIYPCSPMQQSILSGHAKRQGFYEIHTIFKLTSKSSTPIDIQQLHSAWQFMIDRHPILRTLFIPSVSRSAQYDQVVLRPGAAKARLLHYNAMVEGTQLAALPELTQMLPNPLDDDPAALPHRLTTVSTPSGAVFVRAEISHALIDGMTLQTLLDEFGAAYYGTLNPIAAPTYSEYIEHIQSQSNADSTVAAREYWSSYLRKVTEACRIPSLLKPKDAAAIRELRTTHVPKLPSLDILNAFCKHNNVTLSSLLRTTWALLLASHTQTRQVSFGYIVAGSESSMPRIGEAVGPFFNLLPCSLSIERQESIKDVLEKMQNDATAALPYQDAFIKDVCDAMGVYNSIFNFRKYATGNATGGVDETEDSIEWKPVKTHDPFEYDVAVEILEAAGVVSVELKWWTGRIGEKQAGDLADGYKKILEAIVSGSNLVIADLRKVLG